MSKTKTELMNEIERVLDTLRQGIELHGGFVELQDVDLETGKVTVRLGGACVGCPLVDLTLKAGIEEELCRRIPEVKEVVANEEATEVTEATVSEE